MIHPQEILNKMLNKARLNFEFSEDRVGDLRKLQSDTNTENMKDLVDNAFTILEWAVNETKAGNEIVALDKSKMTYRVLIMPLLQRVQRKYKPTSSPAVATTP